MNLPGRLSVIATAVLVVCSFMHCRRDEPGTKPLSELAPQKAENPLAPVAEAPRPLVVEHFFGEPIFPGGTGTLVVSFIPREGVRIPTFARAYIERFSVDGPLVASAERIYAGGPAPDDLPADAPDYFEGNPPPIEIPISAATDTPVGNYRFTGVVYYFYCTEDMGKGACLRGEETLTGSVEVVAQEAANKESR